MRLLRALPCLLLLTACNGILDSIYDHPSDPEPVAAGLPYGFQRLTEDSLSGTLFFNSTSYTRWTYFCLRHPQAEVLDFAIDITSEALATNEPAVWDLALHRSVPKTNGGRVAETPYGSLPSLIEACRQAGGAEALVRRDALMLQPDEWGTEQVAVDMSDMLSGNVVYLPSSYNPVLNRWLDIDISTPPPIYTMSRRAYILQLATGEYYGLFLANFRNSRGITAWLTIDFARL